MPINLIIVDDHEMFRNELKEMLSRIDKDFEVIADAANGKECVDLVIQEQPNIILMDVEMPVMNGIEATHKIIEQYPEIGIIGFSMSGERYTVCDMIEAGARGYLLKNTHKDELRLAIRKVYEGGCYYSKEVSKHIN
jgi:DNA-binding NarL/FixJ family response regulator